MIFAILVIQSSARPAGTQGWIVLGGALAAAIIAGVLAGAGLLSLAGPLDEPTAETFFLGLAVLAAGPLVGWIARRIAHRLAGEDSPWRMRGYRNTETNYKGRKT